MKISELKLFAENTPLVAHNAKFERKYLLHRGIDPNIVDDTLLLAYLYDERLPLDLESLCLKFEIDKVFKEEYGLDVSKLTGKRLMDRNVRDARNTLLLRNKLRSLLSEKEIYVYEKVLLPATRSLALIENAGVCIDREAVSRLQLEIDDYIAELELQEDPYIKEFQQVTEKEFNINSSQHRGILIYDMLGYPPLPYTQAQTEEGDPSTQIKVLKKLILKRKTETLDKLIKYSSYMGWKEAYDSLLSFCDKCGKTHWDTIDGKDYIFTSLGIGETTTGRIKSSHPNMQNTPAREGAWTRKVFPSRSPNGLIIECDYDQIELKMLAGLSQDERLLEDFASGKDLHVEMAKIAFQMPNLTKDDTKYRDMGKTLNYAIPFGRGAGGIAFDTGRTVGEARLWLSRYWAEHPKLKEYLASIPQEGIVYSPTGMKRHCETWTQGKNFPIQNSALIVLLHSLNQVVDRARELKCIVDLCIHDSIRFDLEDVSTVKKVIPEIKERVEFGAGEMYSWLPIPLTVSFKAGRTWGECSKETFKNLLTN